MKSIAELNAIREKMAQKLGARESVTENDTRIIVGMATCGIATGARPVLNTFMDEVAKRNLSNVKVTQTGCIGMCKLEPIVQVAVPGKELVTYVYVTPEDAKTIVAEHIVNGNVVKKLTVQE
jgi:NADP-reducing hydrogenase subunit HndB